MRPHVSICIATYRRPRGLARLLDSLERLKLPPDLVVETIVVDNDAEGSALSIRSAHFFTASSLARTSRTRATEPCPRRVASG
jgi:GT2 family glycosyltransferase